MNCSGETALVKLLLMMASASVMTWTFVIQAQTQDFSTSTTSVQYNCHADCCLVVKDLVMLCCSIDMSAVPAEQLCIAVQLVTKSFRHAVLC